MNLFLELFINFSLPNKQKYNKYLIKSLKSANSLKSLSLSYCSRLSDSIFPEISIKSPLEELDLTFVKVIFLNSLNTRYPNYFVLNIHIFTLLDESFTDYWRFFRIPKQVFKNLESTQSKRLPKAYKRRYSLSLSTQKNWIFIY